MEAGMFNKLKKGEDKLRFKRNDSLASNNGANAYINDAFSFLHTQNYSAYKHYDEPTTDDVDAVSNGSQNTNNNSRNNVYSISHANDFHNTKNGVASSPQYGQKVNGDEDDSGLCCSSKRRVVACVLVMLILLVIGAIIFVALYITGVVNLGQDAETTTIGPLDSYEGFVRLNETWSEDLYDSSSPNYINISSSVAASLSSILNDSDYVNVYSLEVTLIRPGSIEVLFRLMLSIDVQLDQLFRVIVNGFKSLQDSNRFAWRLDPDVDIVLETLLGSTASQLSTSSTTIFFDVTTNWTETTSTTPSQSTQTPSTDSRTTAHLSTTEYPLSTTTPAFDIVTKRRTTFAPATCELQTKLTACRSKGFNVTGFPNSLNQDSQEAAAESMLGFYESLQRGCYEHTLLFGCALLFPKCTETGRLVGPCRSLCTEFVTACRYPILCDITVDDDVDSTCIGIPGKVPATSPRPPFSNPCEDDHFLCGNDQCIPTNQQCDGHDDCGDLSDEIECAGDTSSALDCSFENDLGGDICQYSLGSHFNWSVAQGRTVSPGTGPLYDHTTRTEIGHYALAEASGQIWQDRAELIPPNVTLTEDHCLRFYYHMYGDAVEKLEVLLSKGSRKEEVVVVWERSRNHGDHWLYGQVTIESGDRVQSFAATRGNSHLGDVALDDITLRPGVCPYLACRDDEFTCGSGSCLPVAFVCDGKNDCGDYSDERNCECADDEFQCDMGMCVLDYHQCDNVFDCPDHSDELNCECPQGQYRCNNGSCIMKEWVCDGDVDCPLGEDELNCGTCEATQFKCDNFECIDQDQMCDGVNNCADGSDEYACIRQRTDMVIEVYRERAWLPVCSTGLPTSEDLAICKKLGNKGVIQRNKVRSESAFYMVYDESAPADASLLERFAKSEDCSSEDALSLECISPECGYTTVDGVSAFVVNGRDASPGEWPWHIGLFRNGQYTCGGTLISSRHVITAAHCVGGGFPPASYHVRAGSILATSENDPNLETYSVKSFTTHPDFSVYYLGSDIAILILRETVTYTDYIRPICLPDVDQVIPISSLCFSTGFGMTDGKDENSISETLQEAKMQLYTDAKCKKDYFFVTADFQCAGYESGYISNCQGDSGGPLMCRGLNNFWYLVGTFSFITRGCSVPGKSSVFAKIQNYLTWIDAEMDCQFQCDSGVCLFDLNDLCNGVNDCGDYSDEMTPCNPTANCNFDDIYKCGYQNPLLGPASNWQRERINKWPNEGPFVDHTSGNGTGYFLWAAIDASTILTPVLESVDSPRCMRFNYHMRSPAAGQLRLFALPVNDTSVKPFSLDPYENREDLKTITGNQGDIWHLGYADIPTSRIVVGFEAVATERNQYSAVAVDDVVFVDGTCDSQVCGEGQLPCDGDKSCYSDAEECNYHTFCLQETDELNCSDDAKNTYDCDFQDYGQCALEQSTADLKDWMLVLPTTANIDIAVVAPKGYMLYLDWRFTNAGKESEFTLPIQTSPRIGCLQITYSMFSSATLIVTFRTSSDIMETAFARLGHFNRNWTQAEIPLPVGIKMISFKSISALDDETAEDYTTYVAISKVVLKDMQCDFPVCRPGEYQCRNGQCVDGHFRCDGFTDCVDKSDEDNCECYPDSFICGDNTCLSGFTRCNAFENCADGSDEESCQHNCRENEYQCADGTCMSKSTWCDGIPDCPDTSDELSTCLCFEEQFACLDAKTCIMGYRYCDGHIDCKDGSDEDPNCDCDSRWQFKCQTDDRCIPLEWRCDNKTDCVDGSDEHCVCTDEEFMCENGLCINEDLFCNGQPNCPLGEDEPEGCECGPAGFRCASGGCIHKLLECNFNTDCADGSDEHVGCECAPGDIQCPNGLCIYPALTCDGYNDCGDYYDEKNCTCRAGQFKCDNGVCIDALYECNNDDNCGDESDEQNCACRIEEHRCPDGRCIQQSWVCDGDEDCEDGSDEKDCNTCADHQFRCADYECVNADLRCEGTKNCADNSDETGCVTIGVVSGQNDILKAFDGEEMVPVCAEGILQVWLPQLCKALGQGAPLAFASIIADSGEHFMTIVDGASDVFSMYDLEYTNQCPGDSVLRLSCRASICGQSATVPLEGPAPFIIGGDLASSGQWPWALALMYRGQYRCSAVLIDNGWAMTAAHCFFWSNGYTLEFLPHYFTLRAGTNSLITDDEHTRSFKVRRIVLHPTYTVSTNGFRYQDVALIQLETEVEFTDYIRPACMPESEQTFPRTSTCYITGWGYTKTAAIKPADQLREAKMNLWSEERCKGPRGWGDLIQPATQTCAGYDNGYITTCFGDSGGGLVCRDFSNRWVLYGITSLGPTGCDQATNSGGILTRPGVYATVPAYVDWVGGVLAQYR